jgi:hypothetical protein
MEELEEHLYPTSIRQTDEHPSPDKLLPSSQNERSLDIILPSPQISEQKLLLWVERYVSH